MLRPRSASAALGPPLGARVMTSPGSVPIQWRGVEHVRPAQDGGGEGFAKTCGGIRRTATNLARKSSSSISRTSAEIRGTISSRDGRALDSISTAAVTATGGLTGSPLAWAEARKSASAVASGQALMLSLSPTSFDAGLPIAGSAGMVSGVTMGAGSRRAETSTGPEPLSRHSSRSIRPFFFGCRRRRPPPGLHSPVPPVP